MGTYWDDFIASQSPGYFTTHTIAAILEDFWNYCHRTAPVEPVTPSGEADGEPDIICDGCGKDMVILGEVHETFNADGEPQYCGRGIFKPVVAVDQGGDHGSHVS